jgi:hypothetical protein
MFAYLKNLLRSCRPARVQRAAPSKTGRRARPGLETLEERQLLTNGIMVQIYHDPMTDLPGHYTLGATATSAADTFRFDAPAPGTLGTPTVYFNGLNYTGFNLKLIDHFIFQGVGSGSQATFNVHGAGQPLDPNGYDLRLYGDHGHLQEATYDLTLQKIPIIIANGGAEGWARLYGSNSTPNTFQETPTSSTMVNAMASDQANGFGHVYGFAGDSYNYAFGTKEDTAILHGSELYQSHFVLAANGTPGISVYAAILFNASGTVPYGVGFHNVNAFAGTSSDIVDFRGSKTLVSTYTSHGVTAAVPTYSVLAANNGAYSFEAFGCRYTGAVAGMASDVAVLYGSTTSPNLLFNGPTGLDGYHRSDVHLKSNVHSDEVVGFMRVVAEKGTTSDHAVLAGHKHKDFVIFGNKIDQATGASPGGPSLTYEIDAVNFSSDGDIQV